MYYSAASFPIWNYAAQNSTFPTYVGRCDFTITDVDSCNKDYALTAFNTVSGDDHGHNWDSGTVVPSTYTTKGYTRYTCQDPNCSVTRDENETDYLSQTITLAAGHNCTSAGSATIKKDENHITMVSNPAGTGNLLGYYTLPTGGTKVLDANGNCLKSVSGYTDSNKKWTVGTAATTLYAQYEDGYTVEFYNYQKIQDDGEEYGYVLVGTKYTSGLSAQNVATLTSQEVSIPGLVGWKIENAHSWASNLLGSEYYFDGDNIYVTGNVKLYAVTTTGVSVRYYSNGGSWGDNQSGDYRLSENQELSTVEMGGSFYFPTATATLNRSGYRLHP